MPAVLSTNKLADQAIASAIMRVKSRHLGLGGAREYQRSVVDSTRSLEYDYERWLRTMFGPYFSTPDGEEIPLANFHREMWEWVWSVKRGDKPKPFVGIWPRGAGKSTGAEIACVVFGALSTRRYVLYVCETQEQADDHVGNIASLLESRGMALYYPDLAERMVGKYGNSKGWRRNRLRIRGGYTIDAIGLDSAARGAKLEESRPDLMVLDDLDSELDSPSIVGRKILTLTTKLLPAGSRDLAVLAIQNLVHANGIFSRLADGRAEFLADRILSGPHPALEGMATEQKDGKWQIVAGKPTWEGMPVERCQKLLDDIGLSAFRSECQHDVTDPPGGMFDHLEFRHCTFDELPPLHRVVVYIDPAVESTDDSDCMGIQADGITEDGTVYRLFSYEDRTTPDDALRRGIRKAVELGADEVGVETNQGGSLWESTYRAAWLAEYGTDEEEKDPSKPYRPRRIRFEAVKATSGAGNKVHRASKMLAQYERGEVVHVIGTHHVLERALRRFPKTKPYDLVDAATWAMEALGHGKRRFLRI